MLVFLVMFPYDFWCLEMTKKTPGSPGTTASERRLDKLLTDRPAHPDGQWWFHDVSGGIMMYYDI